MKTTKEKIEVMQAFVDGRAVECRIASSANADDWASLIPGAGEVMWNWERLDYRIKPEPREFWLVIDCEGDIRNTTLENTTEEGAKILKADLESIGRCGPYIVSRFREVIEP